MGVAKTKALISFAVTAKLICAFVFAYADCWFSHGAAHLFIFAPEHNCRHSSKHASCVQAILVLSKTLENKK